ncbi:MAG: VTT domain-containing protein [Acidobacteria bacterium]|nr:VTT domain-containing protein [Acidobacteriota bacterium]
MQFELPNRIERRRIVFVAGGLIFAVLSAALDTSAAERIEMFGADVAGLPPLAIFFLIAAATLVSEDLAAISAGVLASQGAISFPLAVTSAAFGILVGDILLFLAGRLFGRRALRFRPVRFFVSESAVERSSHWLEKRGMAAVFVSRFIFGLRLPLYFAAGVLKTSFWKFTFFFSVAVIIWTPVLVGASFLLGAQVVTNTLLNQNLLLSLAAAALVLYFGVHLVQQAATHKGRRILLGKIKRRFIWEFWSIRDFYIPVVAKILTLAVRYRSLTVFTCANPGIPAGGFVGESKDGILRMVNASPAAEPFSLRHALLSGEAKFQDAKAFMSASRLGFPIVLKPDAGERGFGVRIVRTEGELEELLADTADDQVIQEFAPGEEVSVFYYRFPATDRGEIFAITEKRFPFVVGDGESTLEELILDDDRAICLAKSYLEQNDARLDDVPLPGEKVAIIDIGTHSRGAIFLDGERLRTPELESVIDRICRGIEGFNFGRFDIRVRSFEDFSRGESFRIVELNGVTSEATNIYDPKYTLRDAYRKLFRQWEIAFEIGVRNRELGVRPATVRELLKMVFGGV